MEIEVMKLHRAPESPARSSEKARFYCSWYFAA